MFRGLTTKSSLLFKDKGDELYVPCAKGEQLTSAELALYHQMGNILMFCYRSQTVQDHWDTTYLTGQHLHPSVVAAAKQLTPAEIDTPFTQLSAPTKLRLMKTLAESQGSFENLIKDAHEYLSLPKEQQTDDAAQAVARAIAEYGTVTFPDELLVEGDEDEDEERELDLDKVNRENIQAVLWKALKDLTEQLAPIQAIAFGMKQGCHLQAQEKDAAWAIFQSQNAEQVNAKIQGSLNKENIATNIINNTSNERIGQKIQWLKEWIREKATEKEVKDFLKFTTGSSSFPQGKQIKVNTQVQSEGRPYVAAAYVHTCSYEMELCPDYIVGGDDTKENFIESIKAALGTAHQYSMV
jgi:hypothetical protein